MVLFLRKSQPQEMLKCQVRYIAGRLEQGGAEIAMF